MTPARPLKPLTRGGDLGETILDDLGIARQNGQQLDDLIGWERARVAKP